MWNCYFQEGKEISNSKTKNDGKQIVLWPEIIKEYGHEDLKEQVSQYFLKLENHTGKEMLR